MFSLRGDAHKLYLQLKRSSIKEVDFHQNIKLTEVKEIQTFYQTVEKSTLKLIYYRMIKEKNGSGIIPIYISSIPWLLFLFSQQLQKFLFKEGSLSWAIFGVIYICSLTISVILHFREKAWAAFHIEIIQDILKEKEYRMGNKDYCN